MFIICSYIILYFPTRFLHVSYMLVNYQNVSKMFKHFPNTFANCSNMFPNVEAFISTKDMLWNLEKRMQCTETSAPRKSFSIPVFVRALHRISFNSNAIYIYICLHLTDFTDSIRYDYMSLDVKQISNRSKEGSSKLFKKPRQFVHVTKRIEKVWKIYNTQM